VYCDLDDQSVSRQRSVNNFSHVGALNNRMNVYSSLLGISKSNAATIVRQLFGKHSFTTILRPISVRSARKLYNDS
jgi:endonuclease V-like protein UPF0215 family